MRVRILVQHLYLLLPPRASLVVVQSLLTSRLHTPLLFFPPTHTITHCFAFIASTTVGREGPMSWGFIRLHAIGLSPWKVDGSLTTKIVFFPHSDVHYRSGLLSLQVHESITRVSFSGGCFKGGLQPFPEFVFATSRLHQHRMLCKFSHRPL